MAEVRERARQTGEALAEYANRLDSVIVLIRAIDQGKEHRMNVAAALAGLGGEPPDLDGRKHGAETGLCA